MNDETFEQIEGATTASEAWTILSTNYKGDDKIKRVRLQTLRRQYELLQMETTETIDVYIDKVIALTNQMKTNGETHSEQAKVEKILRSKGDNHVANCAQEDSNHIQDEEDHTVLMATTSNETPNNQTWFVPVTGKGQILITLKNGDHRYIYDVFYVPDMKSNLLSMGQLAEKGYEMHIVENKLSIFDQKKSLENLSNRNLVNGLPHIHYPDQLCEACIFGKNHRTPFVKKPWRAKFPLELVHTNVFGSITYAHVPNATRSKLDDKVMKTIFIGYKHGGYKLYNPMTKKVIISRDVTFA
ncbi:uncharacterized protein [Phaseolus vulgaris]|uniref:uncharacterized protein n=1 Tax=Phaseolus vulgaris TaxID=3885 RepID=UPI0035CAD6B7